MLGMYVYVRDVRLCYGCTSMLGLNVYVSDVRLC